MLFNLAWFLSATLAGLDWEGGVGECDLSDDDLDAALSPLLDGEPFLVLLTTLVFRTEALSYVWLGSLVTWRGGRTACNHRMPDFSQMLLDI